MAARIAGGILAIAGILVLGAWFAFVPQPREPGYRFVATWGEKGVSPGQFNEPTGIAVAGEEVFVADARNGRIQVFDLSGRFRRTFGRSDQGSGGLGRPMNMAVAKDALYIADYWHDRVLVFGLDGAPRPGFGAAGTGPGQFNAPGGVAVAPDGDLYVADFNNQRVQHLRADGTFVDQLGETGKRGVAGGRFNYPTDVALGPNGTLYVADGYNDRVQAFAPDGQLLGKWGGPFALNVHGPFNGWFTTVTGIAVDAQGHVFVADFYNHRVQKFAADGTFLAAFGRRGPGPGEFEHPLDVAVAADGTVFVTDYGNHRVQAWRPVPRP
jgi:DNA-binding beta-propeller fold protein YncE